MLGPRNTTWVVFSVLILVALPYKVSSTGLLAPDTPPGFSLVVSATGVELYRKDYQEGNPDFVQVVNLTRGASVKVLHGNITNPGTGQGVYGGDNPEIARQTLREAWNSFSSADSDAFCITNGQFFSTNDNPTKLAFPLKKDGRIVSDGYGINEYSNPNQKLMLEIWKDRANITPLTKDALYSSPAPDIIVGLAEDANKGPNGYVGRTFVGIDDNNNDGQHETILIFNSKTARQPDAASVLRSFGADRIIMLDGGGSTQLTCKNIAYISSSRSIPQTLAVASSTAPDLSATVVNQPNLLILIEGEALQVEIEIENTGSETWESGKYQLVNRRNRWGADERLPLQNDARPGETVVFFWTTDEFSKWGVYSTEWYMARGDVEFPGEPIKLSVIVLPRELEDKRKELEEEIEKWTEEQIEDIEQLVVEWIQEQINETITEICNPTAAMLPIAILVLVNVSKRRWRVK